ncbi:MAG: exodeoxyribonuclease VII large subunit, partial [Flavobacteriales bacterium]
MSQATNKPLRLSELTTALDDFFKKKFTNRPVWVIGEISNHQFYQKNGRHYFNLIEKYEGRDQIASQMQAIAWGNVQSKIEAFEQSTGQIFTTGLEVLLQMEVTFHPMYGMKLTLLDVDPSFTMGRMEKKRLETLNKLRTEHPEVVRKVGDNYRTFNQDRPLPKVINKIALVTSSQAAGYDDFLHTLKNNPWGYQFAVDHYFAPVQGMESWPKITSRIAEVNSKFEEYDVVVIVRGGGSRTDLALFDQYELSLEIARCAVPVITGIGHQRDESIADLFCHTRLKTPTKVAEFILAQNLEFEQVLLGANDRVQDLAQGMLKAKKRKLNSLSIAVTAGIPQKLRQLRNEQSVLSRKLLTSVQKN